MVHNILFFGSAILTPQNIWLNSFVIAYCAYFREKNEIGRVVFTLISINYHGGAEKFDFPLHFSPGVKFSIFITVMLLFLQSPNLSQTSLTNSAGKCFFKF